MINDLNRYMEGLWNWDSISEVLPGKARIGDIDGAIERRGKLLMLETKAPGVSVPRGQEIMFSNLAKTGIVTTFVLWGRQNQPEAMQAFTHSQIYPKRPATTETVREAVRQWYRWADRKEQD